MHTLGCSMYPAIQANTSGYNRHKSADHFVVLLSTASLASMCRLMDVHLFDIEIDLWCSSTSPVCSFCQLFSQQSLPMTWEMLQHRTHPWWVWFHCNTTDPLCVLVICFGKIPWYCSCPHSYQSNEPKFSWLSPMLIHSPSSSLLFLYTKDNSTCKCLSN